MQNDFDSFAASLSLKGLRNTTIRKILNYTRLALSRVDPLTPENLDLYVLDQKNKGISNSHLNNTIVAIQHWARFNNLDERLKNHKLLPKKYRAKQTLSDDEIEAFLALKRRKNEPNKYYLKYKMFWNIIAFTGLRPGEAAKLKPTHIDWGRGIIQIIESKTNTPGVVPIPENIKGMLKDYLDNLETEYLFPSAGGGVHPSMDGHPVISNVDWHYDFHRRLSILKLVRDNLTPYSFRHSYATRLLEENVSLFHVKKLMRHNDLKSTLVYEHLTTKDLIEAQQRLPLIRRGTSPKNILLSLAELLKAFHIERDDRFHYRLEENDHSLRFEVHLKEVIFLLVSCHLWVTYSPLTFA